MKLLDTVKTQVSRIIRWFLNLSLLKKGLVIIAILILSWLAWNKVFAGKSSTPQYQTAIVTKGTLVSSVTVSGTVSSANSAAITTKATGVVNTVYVKNGDTVSQGDKIAEITLDSSSQQQQTAANASYLSAVNSLNTAQSKINSLKASLFKANQTFLQDRGINSPSDDQKADPQYIIEESNWLQAEADYKNQTSAVAQAQANVTSSWLSYQQTSATVTAPISGTISNLKIAAGSPILASASTSSNNNSTSVQTLGNVTLEGAQPQTTVSLTEIDVVNVKVGEKVTLTLDAFPGKTFTGAVASIDTNGLVSSGVTTYPTVITFDTAPKNMYPNMAVTAQIITSVTDNALTVPTQAIQTQNGTAYVQILKNGQSQQVEVTTGKSSDTETQITSGVNEGDTVITSTATQTSTSTSTASPFGGTGLGGVRTFGGGTSTRTGR